MQITEADVFSFGKLQKRKFHFAPGINVVHGENESGKTTLHAFLVSMLFGLEKGRGRTRNTEGYLRYEPWHAPAYYNGAMRFAVDGRHFYLERSFYHREKRELLRNEEDGEELSVAYGDLTMLLGGISKEIYGNTYDIPQSGAVTEQELGKMLTEYLADAAEGGSAGIHVSRAFELLDKKKKELSADLKNEQERKKHEEYALAAERELLEQDCLKLRSELAAEAELSRSQGSVEDGAASRTQRAASIGRYIGIAVLLAVMLLNGLLYWRGAYSALLFGSVELVAGIAALLLLLFQRRGKVAPTESAVTASVQTEGERQQSERLLGRLQDSLAEKEVRLYNITERLEALKLPGEHERELLTEMDAVLLAKEEIEKLAREFGEERKDEIASEVSRYVSAVTGGRYDSVRIDENGRLRVLTDGREIPPEALSRGTLEQFYLAFRIAVGNVAMKEEPMPLLLDETFSMYDDVRLKQTLQMLCALETQVILFTCQRREINLLEEAGIAHHVIRI